MEEQQKVDLKQLEVVHKALEEFQETTKAITKSANSQTPIVWCGAGIGHDVTISLVPNRFNRLMNKPSETVTKVKIHSRHLIKHSKYFETCLTERWKSKTETSASSLEFVLETHADIVCYTDCFDRMFKPSFFKDFKDVNYSLGLLKAASQIQFLELMDSVALYLATKMWSDADEMAIRMYSTRDDFPRTHARDLVARLGMDVSEEDCHMQLTDVIEKCLRSALAYDGNFRSNRDLVVEMLSGTGLSLAPGSGINVGLGSGGLSVHSNCMEDVVMIVNKAAKGMVVDVEKGCEGKTCLSVPRLADKILAVCWILETVLAAKVAEELVQRLVHLRALPKILAIDSPNHFGVYIPPDDFVKQRVARTAAVELAKLVLVVYQEVAAGNLLLKTPERIALLEN